MSYPNSRLIQDHEHAHAADEESVREPDVFNKDEAGNMGSVVSGILS